jgi:hypothetical protein
LLTVGGAACHPWPGRYGRTDNGVVTVTTVCADERFYNPVHVVPYTPARHFAKGKNDPAFRTRLAIGADLAVRAQDVGFAFQAVVADSADGDQDGFRSELAARRLVVATAGPPALPPKATWYLVTSLPRPRTRLRHGRQAADARGTRGPLPSPPRACSAGMTWRRRQRESPTRSPGPGEAGSWADTADYAVSAS